MLSLLPVIALAFQVRAADPPLALKSEDGAHAATLSLSTRFRVEGWDSRATNTEWFQALRTRVGLHYTFQDLVTGFAEFQDARIHGLDPDATGGAAGLYYVHNGRKSKTHGSRVRQLWLQLQPMEGMSLRAGRQDIKLGTEVMYPEGNWKYLKVARGSQRLVGTVGWSHAERSNDGLSVAYDMGDHHLYFFGAKPTTGVFDLDSSYAGQNDILYGGASWTAKRGTWLPNTEVRLFGLGYKDDRGLTDGGPGQLSDDEIEIYTLGFSSIGVHPMGAGNFDLLVWGAYQFGDWAPNAAELNTAVVPLEDLDHRAWAAIAEAGYQFTEAAWKPWLRAGVNVASGDGSNTDGDHGSFFNMLPTNHLYYGFSDQFAFSNLVNYFAQLKLAPTERFGVNLFLHHFTLLTDDDQQYRGTGAFNKNAFGYAGRSSAGHHALGTAVDVVVDYKLHPRVGLQAGYSYMDGHGLFNNFSDDATRFGYFQLSAQY